MFFVMGFAVFEPKLRGGCALLVLPAFALLLVTLQGKLGAPQSFADFFGRIGRGCILEVFVDFVQVLVLLFYV